MAADLDSLIAKYRNEKPVEPIVWPTIEIYNETTGVFRFVRDYADKTFTIESGADRNAGEAVDFKAIGFSAPSPSQGSEPSVTINVTLQRVGSEMKAQLKKLRGFLSFNPAYFVWREYISTDTSAPVSVYYLYVKSISMDSGAITIVASDENPLAQPVSSIATVGRFPALADL